MTPVYPFTLTPLSKAEGGGWLITYPDLPGCMSDGETEAEAIENGRDALKGWLAVAQEMGHPIPAPSTAIRNEYSGKYQQRLPKSLHRKLAERARQEGVSLNQLAAAFIAEGLGAHAQKASS